VLRFEPGQILAGRFRIDELTERGAVAWDEELERTVELEPLQGDSASEAQRLAAIIHPNLQAIYAVATTEAGEAFVVREHLPGVALAEWVEAYDERALPVDAVVGMLDPIALALEALHREGRAHGHVDERHIQVGPSFRVCLLSPGSAMAPSAPVEAEGDLRALGELAHRLLTGSAPEPGVAPSACRPGLSRAFDRPLTRMLGDEPHSAETFRQRMAVAQAFAAATPLAHTILLIDVDEAFRKTLAGILRQAFPDARFVHQSSGREALQLLRTREVSLIVSELSTEDIDAFELAEALGKDSHTRSTPLLVVTGTGAATDWRRLSGLGVDAFLFKPVDATSLIASSRRLIGAPEPPRFPDVD
jgi:CheY-like chemotaxis protein